MSFLPLIWLFLVFWYAVASMSGLLTKKERLTIVVILDVIAVIFSVQLFVEASHLWSHAFWAWCFYNNIRASIRDYKRWQNTDDDDDWKQRRKSWAKSHLPKPVTREIPMPV